MRLKHAWFIVVALALLASCKDNTGSLGNSIMPDEDLIQTGAVTYYANTQSIAADSVFARTSTAFLGKYTDQDFGVFSADFITQFNCMPLLHERERVVGNVSANIQFLYSQSGFFGDPYSASRLSIYRLAKEIEDDPNVYYYTDIDPSEYIGEVPELLCRKAYSPRDPLVSDSLWSLTTYSPYIHMPLPDEEGQRIYDLYDSNPEYFENAETFKKDVFKGVYVKCDYGDGAILYIDRVLLNITGSIFADSSGVWPIKRKQVDFEGKDSIWDNRILASFANTREVIQANHFENSDKLNDWIADEEHTYLKSPAGIFTEVELPLDSLIKYNATDTLNSVQISFNNYSKVSNTDKNYEMPTPTYVLMVRKQEMHSFFEKNKLPDNVTSFIATHDATNNQYAFSNISRLITTCLNEKKEGIADEDWNKVVLIPVSIVMDSNNESLIAIRHDLRLTNVKMKKGEMPQYDLKGNISNKKQLIDVNIIFTKL